MRLTNANRDLFWDALALIAGARTLITRKRLWCRDGRAFRDGEKKRRRCSPLSKRAVCWCASGALERVGGTDTGLALTFAHDVLRETAGGRHVSDVNDNDGHRGIISLLDAASERLERQLTGKRATGKTRRKWERLDLWTFSILQECAPVRIVEESEATERSLTQQQSSGVRMKGRVARRSSRVA